MSQELRGEHWLRSPQKRAFDIAATTVTAPLLAPLAAIGALSFFAESRVNPFFLQMRQGHEGRTVRILKLRTMPFSEDFHNPSNGADDHRASRVGRILRRLSLDEVPQAFHIIAGQMSVVGPRPLITEDVERTLDVLSASEQREWLHARHVSRPGWYSPFGNVSRELDPMSEQYLRARAEMDCDYAESASMATDWQIIRDGITRHRASLTPETTPAPQ